MVIKIMENVSNPKKIFSYTGEELSEFYYTISNPQYPVVELNKILPTTNSLEECGLAFVKKEVQIQIFKEEQLVKSCTAELDRYMIFEAGGDLTERLIFNVKEANI